MWSQNDEFFSMVLHRGRRGNDFTGPGYRRPWIQDYVINQPVGMQSTGIVATYLVGLNIPKKHEVPHRSVARFFKNLYTSPRHPDIQGHLLRFATWIFQNIKDQTPNTSGGISLDVYRVHPQQLLLLVSSFLISHLPFPQKTNSLRAPEKKN